MFFYDPTFLLLIPALIFAFWAQWKVQHTYRKYSEIPASNGLTGRDMAAAIMQRNGIGDVGIEEVPGALSDHYDPRVKMVRLSPINYERRHEEQAVDPGAHQPAAVLGAVKVRPGDVRACVNAGATADLDRPCARRRQRRVGRDGKTNSAEAEQKNSRKQEDKMPSLQIP